MGHIREAYRDVFQLGRWVKFAKSAVDDGLSTNNLEPMMVCTKSSRRVGVREGLAPVTPGDVARISMILDPDGDWIEFSRRAPLLGSLS